MDQEVLRTRLGVLKVDLRRVLGRCLRIDRVLDGAADQRFGRAFCRFGCGALQSLPGCKEGCRMAR